jgi:hypothetical protein
VPVVMVITCCSGPHVAQQSQESYNDTVSAHDESIGALRLLTQLMASVRSPLVMLRYYLAKLQRDSYYGDKT